MTPSKPRLDAAALNQRSRGCLPGLLGLEVTAIESETLTLELTVRPGLLAPNGYLHAASCVALADTACGYGTLCWLPDDARSFTTIELKSNFTGTAREGRIVCHARPLHRGRSTQLWEATVSRADDPRPIAHFRCTQLILY